MKYIRDYIYMGAILCVLAFVASVQNPDLNKHQQSTIDSLMGTGMAVIGSGVIGAVLRYVANEI